MPSMFSLDMQRFLHAHASCPSPCMLWSFPRCYRLLPTLPCRSAKLPRLLFPPHLAMPWTRYRPTVFLLTPTNWLDLSPSPCSLLPCTRHPAMVYSHVSSNTRKTPTPFPLHQVPSAPAHTLKPCPAPAFKSPYAESASGTLAMRDSSSICMPHIYAMLPTSKSGCTVVSHGEMAIKSQTKEREEAGPFWRLRREKRLAYGGPERKREEDWQKFKKGVKQSFCLRVS